MNNWYLLLFTLGLLISLPPFPSKAMGNAPRIELRAMVKQAEVIAIVQDETCFTPRRPGASALGMDGTDLPFAESKVIRLLKGPSGLHHVQAPIAPFWTDTGSFASHAPKTPCERTPRSLLFVKQLDADDDRDVLLDWGRLELPSKELAVFEKHLSRLVSLLGGDSPLTDAQYQDWLVDCAGDAPTRGHCIRELAGPAFLDASLAGDDPSHPLATEQRSRLRAAFVSAPTTDDTFAQVLFLAGHDSDPEFDAVAMSVLDFVLAPKEENDPVLRVLSGPPYWAVSAYLLLSRRLGVGQERTGTAPSRWVNSGGQVWPTAKQLREAWASTRGLAEGTHPSVHVAPRSSHTNPGWARLQ